MSQNLKQRIHNTLVKVMEMQGGARIGVGGGVAGGRRKRRGGVGVGGRKRKHKMHAGVLMDMDPMHPDMYARHSGAGRRKRKMHAGVLMNMDPMHPDMYARHSGAGRKRKRHGGATVGGASRRYRGGANPWITHVKRYAKAHRLSYGEAMKKARASYRG